MAELTPAQKQAATTVTRQLASANNAPPPEEIKRNIIKLMEENPQTYPNLKILRQELNIIGTGSYRNEDYFIKLEDSEDKIL